MFYTGVIFSNIAETIFAATDAEVNDEDLKRNCTRFAASGNKRRRIIEDEYDESGEYSDPNPVIGVELVETEHSFTPLYLISIWVEPRKMTKGVSLAIFYQVEWNVEDVLLVLSREARFWS